MNNGTVTPFPTPERKHEAAYNQSPLAARFKAYHSKRQGLFNQWARNIANAAEGELDFTPDLVTRLRYDLVNMQQTEYALRQLVETDSPFDGAKMDDSVLSHMLQLTNECDTQLEKAKSDMALIHKWMGRAGL